MLQQELFEHIFDGLSDPMVVLDQEYSICSCNKAFQKLTLHAEAELLMRRFSEFVDVGYFQQHDQDDAYQSSLPTIKQQRVRLKRKDGLSCNVLLSICNVDHVNGCFYAVTLQKSPFPPHVAPVDRLAEYEILLEIQERFNCGEPLSILFRHIVCLLLRKTKSQLGLLGSVLETEGGQRYLKADAFVSQDPDEVSQQFFSKTAGEGLEFHNLDSLLGRPLITGEMLISNDVVTDPRASGVPNAHPMLKRYMGVPIYGPSGLVALVGLANREEAYTEELVSSLSPILNAVSGILESRKHLSTLQYMARHDSLTNALTRREFEADLKHALDDSSRPPIATMLIDFDDFKRVNDMLGHHIGDGVLCQFAVRIQDLLEGNQASLYRLGGDEFAIILNEVDHSMDVLALAYRLYEEARQAYMVEGARVSVSASFGVAMMPSIEMSSMEMIKHADFALQFAKRERGVCVYNEEMRTEFREQVKLEEKVVAAIEQSLFDVCFEPQLNILEQQVMGYEALLRWHDDELGVVSPSKFIPAAEKLGLADRVNLFIVERVLTILKKDHALFSKGQKIGINISPKVHDLSAHLMKLKSLVAASGQVMNQFYIEFELTESCFDDTNTELSQFYFQELKKVGVRFAIDDFGVQYSSLNRLLDYPFDTIKIDKSFMDMLNGDKRERAIHVLESIMVLANKLGMDVVAEGVELVAQVDVLKEIGCRHAQGWYYQQSFCILPALESAKEEECASE